MTTILIKNGTVVLENSVTEADIYIHGEIIETISPNIHKAAEQTIDAKGQYVLPGGIDVHTHLELPQMNTVTCDTFESGTKAALFGGTTSIIDFANQIRGESLRKTLQTGMALADGKSYCDFGFHVTVTDVNASTPAEMQTMVEQFGVTSFKTFLAYDNLRISEPDLAKVLTEAKRLGALVTLHAEVGDEIKRLTKEKVDKNLLDISHHDSCHPVYVEADATKTAIDIAAKVAAPIYFVHVSCAEAMRHIVNAKKIGQKVFAESCPQYFLLNNSLYQGLQLEAIKYVMCPPLRSTSDNEALWKHLLAGDVDIIATDHAPFLMKQKLASDYNFTKTPCGAPGLEERVPVMFSEAVRKRGLTLSNFAKIFSTTPAKTFGMYPKKGVLAPGSDADILIIDPSKTRILSAQTHHSNIDYSCYENLRVEGAITFVLLRGQVAINNNKLCLPQGYGQYIKRKNPLL